VRNGRTETRSVRVGAFDYPVQKLTLPPHLVELSPEDAARVNRENAEVAKILDRGGPRRFFLPLADPLSPLPKGGRFGNRRVINGKPRSPHGGADYAAETGVPVLSAADGTVALVADHLLPGRSVFVDHGDSLVTMYFHLSRIDVEQGQPVKRGERIGAVGATGRVTGAHLHFGIRWRKARVDPALLLGRPEALPSVD
jgi:murein DD-endopeptidase MepM/ murein hydrolase activator NlpD